jgi:hypothetical protein
LEKKLKNKRGRYEIKMDRIQRQKNSIPGLFQFFLQYKCGQGRAGAG